MGCCITERKIRELVPDEDYARGLAYYQQGRVHGYREMKAADSVKISCSVQGTRLYSVLASYSAKGVAALCTCRRFGELHSCKHLVAGASDLRPLPGRRRQERPEWSAGCWRRI